MVAERFAFLKRRLSADRRRLGIARGIEHRGASATKAQCLRPAEHSQSDAEFHHAHHRRPRPEQCRHCADTLLSCRCCFRSANALHRPLRLRQHDGDRPPTPVTISAACQSDTCAHPAVRHSHDHFGSFPRHLDRHVIERSYDYHATGICRCMGAADNAAFMRRNGELSRPPGIARDTLAHGARDKLAPASPMQGDAPADKDIAIMPVARFVHPQLGTAAPRGAAAGRLFAGGAGSVVSDQGGLRPRWRRRSASSTISAPRRVGIVGVVLLYARAASTGCGAFCLPDVRGALGCLYPSAAAHCTRSARRRRSSAKV